MLSQILKKTLHRALTLAGERRHEYATLEHLLLSLLDDEEALEVLTACGVNLTDLRQTVSDYVDNDLSALVTPVQDDTKPTAGFQRVLQRADIHVQSSGREEVTGANVLVALFSERESHAVYFLQSHEMSRLDAVNFISHGIAKSGGRAERRTIRGTPDARPQPTNGGDDDSKPQRKSRREQEGGGEKEEAGGALETYCVNLNEKAVAGKIDPLIGREAEVERTIQILCRRTKNNPLYVGDPGVGKTADRKSVV